MHVKKSVSEQLQIPWYLLILYRNDVVYNSLFDGRTLQALEIDDTTMAPLQCMVMQEPWRESSLWMQLSSADNREPKLGYFTHDNGGRPFKVIVSGDIIRVHSATDAYYFRASSIFIGEDRACGTDESLGNSVLIALTSSPANKYKYVFVGDCIYTFCTEEPILHYFSQIGNNDVPYPVGLGPENVYFMLDCRSMARSMFREPDVFSEWEGVYSCFYEASNMTKTPFLEKRMIASGNNYE